MQINDAVRTIKDRLSIVDIAQRYLVLRRNGTRWVAPCPFHQETKPSFSINEERGLFYCFGCQAAGDIFDFYGRINGLDFKESLEQLANEAGIELEYGNIESDRKARRQQRSARLLMTAMHDFTAAFYKSCLDKPDGHECNAYIAARGISNEVMQNFCLGFAPRGWQSLAHALQKGNYDLGLAHEAGLLGRASSGRFYDRFRGRLIFPIKSLSGQTVAFGGRIIAGEDEAKYINSPDTPIYKKGEHLYGLAQARRSIAGMGQALLTEGYMDVLTLHQFGYTNAVGVLGTALTTDQIKRLTAFVSNIALIFDGDRAGRKAAFRAAEMLLCKGVRCTAVILPEGEDIDSLLRTAGKKAFDDLLAKAPDAFSYCVSTLKELAPLQAVDWARGFLSKVEIPELINSYASSLAASMGFSEALLRAKVETVVKKEPSGEGNKTVQNGNMCDLQIMIFATRYPERLNDLKNIGADLALSTDGARRLWRSIEHWGPEDVVYHLDQKQKTFWFGNRGPLAPPLNNGDAELEALQKFLFSVHAASQKSSLSAALRHKANKDDFTQDLAYLRALQETLEKSHE